MVLAPVFEIEKLAGLFEETIFGSVKAILISKHFLMQKAASIMQNKHWK